MKKLFTNKKFSGILIAILVSAAFVGTSTLGLQFLKGSAWYVFSSSLRLIFGIFVLFVSCRLYGRTVGDILSLRNSCAALVGGIGELLSIAYCIVLFAVGFGGISGLTAEIFLTKVILQQLTTGFFEELNCRLLMAEGYFHGERTLKRRLLYALGCFVLFGGLHCVTGWNTYNFVQLGISGLVYAAIYLHSRNIVIPMLLHFIYDIFANMTGFVDWNNSTAYATVCSLYDVVLIITGVLSIVVICMKDKKELKE